MVGEAGALADAELVHSRSEEGERVGERDLDGGRAGRAGAVHATRLGQHAHHRDAVDGQVERVLRDGARGREPGIGEPAHALAVEDLDRARRGPAARAREAHVRVKAGFAGGDARDRHLGAAGVRDAVAVAVGLVGVVDGRAVVAGVAHAVVVGVLLAGVGDGRAVVVAVADAVVIGVRAGRAGVAYVADAVEVAVDLIGIGDGRAVVAGVTHAVAVAVGLVGVVGGRAVVIGVAAGGEVAYGSGGAAVVAKVADAVAVAVLLVGVVGVRAVVDGVADTVAVLVGAGRAPGAGVADAVAVAVGLVGIVDGRAVVAGVADAVAVAVGLVGIVDGRTVVAARTEAARDAGAVRVAGPHGGHAEAEAIAVADVAGGAGGFRVARGAVEEAGARRGAAGRDAHLHEAEGDVLAVARHVDAEAAAGRR